MPVCVRPPATTQLLLPMSSWRWLRSSADGPPAASTRPSGGGVVAELRADVVGREADRLAERRVEVEDVARQERGVDGRVDGQVGVAAVELRQVLDLGDTHRSHGARHVELLAEIAEQAVVARDHDRRGPALGQDPEHLELDRQFGRPRPRLVDIGVDAVDERRDDRLAARVVPVELGLQVAAEHVQARADVALQRLGSEDLGDGAGGLPAPDLELEQAVARRRVALREEQIRLVLRVDVIDAPTVAQHFDRGREPADPQGVGGGCRRRRRAASRLLVPAGAGRRHAEHDGQHHAQWRRAGLPPKAIREHPASLLAR